MYYIVCISTTIYRRMYVGHCGGEPLQTVINKLTLRVLVLAACVDIISEWSMTEKEKVCRGHL